VRPADVVFRPRAGTWLLYGFLTLVVAIDSLYWFFDPVPDIVRYLGGAFIIFWVSYLVSLGRARVELRESTVEIHGPSFQVLHPREMHWLYSVLLLLVIFDVAALFFGPPPLWAQRFLLGSRIVWLLAYLWCFGAFEGGRRSLKYTEITATPWETPLTWASTSTVLQVEISCSTNPFSFPPWLNTVDRSEVAGRVTARVKHAHALQKAQEENPGAATTVAADAPAPP
jgi:hypothetical protein